MKHRDEMEPKLHDHLDGLLSGDATAQLDRHLEECGDCRALLESLRRLRTRAEALPRSLEPDRDLWPGIEAALSRRPAARRGRTAQWAGRLALAASLVAVTAALTAWLVRPGAPPLEPPTTVIPGAALASFREAEVEFLLVTGELFTVLEERRAELSPQTLMVVEGNLRVIDHAIQEVWKALENDPANTGRGHLVTSLYRKKVEILRQAVALPAES